MKRDLEMIGLYDIQSKIQCMSAILNYAALASAVSEHHMNQTQDRTSIMLIVLSSDLNHVCFAQRLALSRSDRTRRQKPSQHRVTRVFSIL
jgi:hypothetical protein